MSIDKLVIEEPREGVYKVTKVTKEFVEHFTCDREMAMLTLYGVHHTSPKALCYTSLLDLEGFHNDYLKLLEQIHDG